ncbi:DUF1919 domain-containing protein [Terrisporobacter petrolearius]|uniref:DUF1919 domain-containing protein n=1 Tax=Terrisporobacter petrolearius TaxID=1460447 RepID=UPI0031CC67E2
MFTLIKRVEWRLYKELKRKRLTNFNPSIISSNCNAGIIYHDLNLPFNSPTINLSMDTDDFIKFVRNMKYYMEQEIYEIYDENYDFPCGMLKDIKIRFNHYQTFQEAIRKWNERKTRINWDNIYILGIDGDNANYSSLKKFDSLPYDNKVIFTHKNYPEIGSAYKIDGFEDEIEVGVLIHFRKKFFIRRYLDDFDYVSFLNKN